MKKFITNVEIKNFKSLKNLKLDLSKNFNVITGNNGSCKTSLLESIIFATDSKVVHNLEIRDNNNAEGEVFIRSNDNTGKDFDVVLLDNFGFDIPESEAISYVEAIKDKYSGKQIIAVSNQKEIINHADNVVYLK